jgi:periplasmic divalent cation tolerance protein
MCLRLLLLKHILVVLFIAAIVLNEIYKTTYIITKARRLENTRGKTMTEFIQVSTTTDKREDAEHISKAIVENRLAACVQISGPVTSIYRWNDNMEESEEWLLTMKTSKNIYPRLEQAIKNFHPYEVPEIVAVPIIAGSKDYLDWLEKETGD